MPTDSKETCQIFVASGRKDLVEMVSEYVTEAEAAVSNLQQANISASAAVARDTLSFDKHVVVGDSGILREAWAVDISDPRRPMVGPVMIYLLVEQGLDYNCKKLSALMPEASLFLKRGARIKAHYKGGERVKSFDYADFYHNLTPEEIQSCMVQDSTDRSWF